MQEHASHKKKSFLRKFFTKGMRVPYVTLGIVILSTAVISYQMGRISSLEAHLGNHVAQVQTNHGNQTVQQSLQNSKEKGKNPIAADDGTSSQTNMEAPLVDDNATSQADEAISERNHDTAKDSTLSSEQTSSASIEPEDMSVADDTLSESSEPVLKDNILEQDVLDTSTPFENKTVLEVGRGDTLMNMLIDHGLDRKEAHNAIQALTKVYNPRRLRPGQTIEVVTYQSSDQDTIHLRGFTLQANTTTDVAVYSQQDGVFNAEERAKPISTKLNTGRGEIQSSLYEAAIDAGLSQKTLASLINIFAFDVDFQREIQKGDTFSLLYETRINDEGKIVDSGDILLAEMVVRGKQKRFYRFEDKNGFVDYYDGKGNSARKALLKTPVDGARISSGFGKRKHPILGYSKLHKGVDFAARKGTPIYAAGDGVVEVAGWNGGFGKYIRIRHNDTYKTAYAHMSRIDRKIKKGARVRQRQVIGYVGSTGRSTGPHLHYEVHKNNRQVNPLGVKLPTGKTLAGNELKRFKSAVAQMESRSTDAHSQTDLAKRN